MSVVDHAPSPGVASLPPPEGGGVAASPPVQAQRLVWLFRASTRAGHVHPLRALLEHYRAGAPS